MKRLLFTIALLMTPLTARAGIVNPSAAGVSSWSSLTTGSSPLEDGPMWMHWFGTGVEADPGPNSFSIQGLHYYANLTISNGQTITVTNNTGTALAPVDKPQGSLVVFSPGTCTIAGTIDAHAIVGGAAANFGGGSAGGSGFGAANGTAGANSNLPGAGGVVSNVPGGTQGTSGVAGGNGGTPTTASQRLFMQNAPVYGLMGGSGGPQGGSSGGAGGAGGGGVVLVCGTLNFTGTITVAGANGVTGGSSTGGGGGGGGGVIVLAGHTVTNSGSLTVTGGTGGSAGTGTSTAGGNGGNGWSSVTTLN